MEEKEKEAEYEIPSATESRTADAVEQCQIWWSWKREE